MQPSIVCVLDIFTGIDCSISIDYRVHIVSVKHRELSYADVHAWSEKCEQRISVVRM